MNHFSAVVPSSMLIEGWMKFRRCRPRKHVPQLMDQIQAVSTPRDPAWNVFMEMEVRGGSSWIASVGPSRPDWIGCRATDPPCVNDTDVSRSKMIAWSIRSAPVSGSCGISTPSCAGLRPRYDTGRSVPRRPGTPGGTVPA